MDLFFEPTQGKAPFSIEVGYFDTILEIKEKIQKTHGIPISDQSFVLNDTILHNDLNIHNSDILNRSRIHLLINGVIEPEIDDSDGIIQPSSTPELSGSNLRIYIVSKSGSRKIGVEVNLSEKVGQLRKKLRNVKEHLQLDLPGELGYYFIYKQNAMDDDQSWKWHNVGQGDCIEIVGGTVSGSI